MLRILVDIEYLSNGLRVFNKSINVVVIVEVKYYFVGSVVFLKVDVFFFLLKLWVGIGFGRKMDIGNLLE